jgi:hypothetical protein
MSQHAQPRATTYLVVAAILTALTAMEVLVYSVKLLTPVLVPVLLVLMVAKFALVAMFYMHLRFEPPLYTRVFAVLLFFGILVVVSLVLLFMYLGAVHHA